MTRVLSIDPGVTSGLAFASIKNGAMIFCPYQAEMRVSAIYELLLEYAPHHIICEDFTFRMGSQRTGLELFSRNVIGVVTLYQELTDCQLYFQQASAGKGYYNDEKLNHHDCYTKALQHGNDAVRHLLHWYTFGAGYAFNQQGFTLVYSPKETDDVLAWWRGMVDRAGDVYAAWKA